MTPEPCPTCKGKCCRDDLGYRVAHYGAELYEHVCEACLDGDKYVPPRSIEDERADVVAYMRCEAKDATWAAEAALFDVSDAIERGEHVGWAKKSSETGR